MSFKILIQDDEGVKHVLHEIDDRRITRMGLTTRNGEAAGVRIDADMTEVLLTFEHVQADGRPTIQDVEALQHGPRTGEMVDERKRILADLPSASNSGLDTMMEAQRRENEEANEQPGDGQERLQRTEDGDDSAVDDTSPTASEGDDSDRDDGSVASPSEGSSTPVASTFGFGDSSDGADNENGDSTLPPTVDPAHGSGVDTVPGADTTPPDKL